MEELVLKGQSLKALREQLMKDNNYSPIVLDSVLLLFRGALIAGTLREAAVHANILRRLLERKFDEQGVAGIDVAFLVRVLYQNGQLSAMRFSRSIIDVENWVPKVLAGHLHPVMEYLKPHRPRFVAKFDSSICIEPLRTLVLDNAMTFWLFTMPAESQPEPNLWALAQLWIHVHSQILPCRLVDFILMIQSNYYLNFDPNIDQPRPNPCENLFWQTQRILALAFLILSEILRAPAPVVKHNLYTKRTDLLARLRISLKLTMRVTRLVEAEPGGYEIVRREHQNAHLWAFCMGAWEEKRTNAANENKKEKWWFTHHFALHARQMGLKDGTEVGKVLEKFDYGEFIMPGADEWVTDILKGREM